MTPGKGTSRRDYLKLMAAGAGLAATAPIMTAGFNGGRKPSSECSFIGDSTA
jgi:hypothetical protein